MNVAARFGANLARCRHARGFSQQQLADAADLHRTEVSLLERGGRCPRIDTVARLAAALSLDPCDLLEGIGDARPPRGDRAAQRD